MLFEPTFITPDVRNGLGAGVIDATFPMVVSWKVNGQPYLAAYQIVIYSNNAASTQLYSTGKLTTNCPFYAMSPDGEPQFFTHTIAATDLSSAGIDNGNEYKMVITQWWSDNNSDKIVQNSASVFITRTKPTVTIATPSSLGRITTFTATYTQAQGDTLNWVRWKLAYFDGTYETDVYDTGEMSGVSQLSFTYDGLWPGSSYYVYVYVQTENGIEATHNILVTLNPIGSITDAELVAKKICGKSAVSVDCSQIVYSYGTPTPSWLVDNGYLMLDSTGKVVWNTVTGNPMDFSAPWSAVWKGKLFRTESANLFTLTTPNYSGNLKYRVDYIPPVEPSTPGSIRFACEYYGTLEDVKYIDVYFSQNTTVCLVLTPTKMYLRVEDTASSSLYPSNSLYPQELLYPRMSGQTTVQTAEVEVKYYDYYSWAASIQRNISSVSVGGTAYVDFMQIRKGALEDDEWWSSMEMLLQYYNPTKFTTNSDYFFAGFSTLSGLNAGNIILSEGDTFKGISLYRRDAGVHVLEKVVTIGLARGLVIYDYAVKSQQGECSWVAFPESENGYITSGINSEKLNLCFWNWTVLECVQRKEYITGLGNRPIKNAYTVLNEYAFGKNLTSGTMSNNNSPAVRQNLTRYPTVQKAKSNYQSGTLTSLIGVINSDRKYSDTISLRDAIYALSTTENHLFLKNRKGDLLRIRISAPVEMTTMDDTREQAQTVTLPWVEIGSADNVSLIAYEDGGV